jgi:3-phosphoshikimate 1-carboxyvinyltransferase
MKNASITLPRFKSAQGSVIPPGSKSVANRILPIAATGKGEIRIDNVPDGEDVGYMLESLKLLGVSITREGSSVTVKGKGGPFQNSGVTRLFLGNSGTATRFLTAMLCAGRGDYEIDGIQRLRERPIGPMVDGLRQLTQHEAINRNKTKIRYLEKDGFPPFLIKARGLPGGRLTVKGDVSSQFISGLLLAFPHCKSATTLQILDECVSAPYIQLTVNTMKKFGANVERGKRNTFHYKGPAGYRNPLAFFVEADASSASYFLAAGALAGGPVTVMGVGRESMQATGEGRFAKVLDQMGACVQIKSDAITVSRGNLKAVDINMDEMTDTAMTLAVLSLFAEGTTRIHGIGNWRLKETDRLRAMSTELRKLGAYVREGKTSLIIRPPKAWRSAEITTYNDHRMAMSFTLAAFSKVDITLLNPECVGKTFPNYFKEFFRITT